MPVFRLSAVGWGYTPQPLMAVPKRKTSRSRRDKRRATACDLGAARAGLPDLPAAEARASRLPELQDVQGPGRRAAPHPGSVALPRRYSAHDPCRGRRPRRRPRSGRDRRRAPPRAASPDIQPILFGPPALEAQRPPARRDVTRRSTWTSLPSRPCGRSRTRRSSTPSARSRTARQRRVVSAGSTGAMLAASLFASETAAGRPPAGDRGRAPRRARPERPHRRRRQRGCTARSTSSSSRTWARSSRRRSSASPSPRSGFSRSARRPGRGTSSRSTPTSSCGGAVFASAGNTESRRLLEGGRGRRRHGRLHRQHRPEGARGHDPQPARLAPRRARAPPLAGGSAGS